jgi:hypothetical protein
MQTNNPSYFFLSVFYKQADWHLLLNIVREELMYLRLSQKCITDYWVFLNKYRGTSIRIMVECPAEKEKEALETFLTSLQDFVRNFPSEKGAVSFPIQSFFADYPNNNIKFNLFDKTVIIHPDVSRIQAITSNILLAFFDEHPVDDDAVFTLVLYLQYAAISALTTNNQAKLDFYEHVINAMNKHSNYQFVSANKEERLDEEVDLDMLALLPEHLLNLINQFQEEVKRLAERGGSDARLYFTIMSVLQLHLFKIPEQVFFDAAYMMRRQLKQEIQKLMV